jgi:hypothetical protein
MEILLAMSGGGCFHKYLVSRFIGYPSGGAESRLWSGCCVRDADKGNALLLCFNGISIDDSDGWLMSTLVSLMYLDFNMVASLQHWVKSWTYVVFNDLS